MELKASLSILTVRGRRVIVMLRLPVVPPNAYDLSLPVADYYGLVYIDYTHFVWLDRQIVSECWLYFPDARSV